MACLLQTECNLLHRFFRCWLPVEVVDIEVKITSMQGTHTFRRDRTTQLIKCTPWSTRLCPHPTIQENEDLPRGRRKMGPYLSPPSSQYRPPQPDTNPRSERTMLQRNERGQHPQTGSDLPQPLSLMRQLCNHL